ARKVQLHEFTAMRNKRALMGCECRKTELVLLQVGGALQTAIVGNHHHLGGNVIVAKAPATATGYCMKCKTQREIKNAKPITMKNGRPATEGTCSVCSTKMFKIGASE